MIRWFQALWPREEGVFDLFDAQTQGGAIALSLFRPGSPASKTHLTGCIAAPVRRASAVRWSIAGHFVRAWIITLPAAAGLGAAFYSLARLGDGQFG